MYHIDQLGRVVQEVPETQCCTGCLYNTRGQAHELSKWVCDKQYPIYNYTGNMMRCGQNKSIFVLVETEQ